MQGVSDTRGRKPSLDAARQRVQQGISHNPFDVLGMHNGEICVFLPAAESVVLEGAGDMQRAAIFLF